MGAVASPEKPVADDGTATKTPSGGRVPRADTRELLMAYFCVLDVVQDDGSTGLRPPGRLSRVKPTVGLQSHVTEHVRTNVDRFSRRYRARLALGQDDGNDEDDRTALEDFAGFASATSGARLDPPSLSSGACYHAARRQRHWAHSNHLRAARPAGR